MNEERLCRGKRLDNGQWAQGYIVEQNTPEYHAYIITDFCAEVDDRHVDILECDIHEVGPDTVGRNTGLSDANGEKVFEGDVIRKKHDQRNVNNVNYVVEWYNGGFVFRDTKIRAFGSDLTQTDAEEMEIVGNIHDNPELLHSDGTM